MDLEVNLCWTPSYRNTNSCVQPELLHNGPMIYGGDRIAFLMWDKAANWRSLVAGQVREGTAVKLQCNINRCYMGMRSYYYHISSNELRIDKDLDLTMYLERIRGPSVLDSNKMWWWQGITHLFSKYTFLLERLYLLIHMFVFRFLTRILRYSVKK